MNTTIGQPEELHIDTFINGEFRVATDLLPIGLCYGPTRYYETCVFPLKNTRKAKKYTSRVHGVFSTIEEALENHTRIVWETEELGYAMLWKF